MPISVISSPNVAHCSSSASCSAMIGAKPLSSAICCSASAIDSCAKASVSMAIDASIHRVSASARFANVSRISSIFCCRISSSLSFSTYSAPCFSTPANRSVMVPSRFCSENWRIGGHPSPMMRPMSAFISGSAALRPASSSSYAANMLSLACTAAMESMGSRTLTMLALRGKAAACSLETRAMMGSILSLGEPLPGEMPSLAAAVVIASFKNGVPLSDLVTEEPRGRPSDRALAMDSMKDLERGRWRSPAGSASAGAASSATASGGGSATGSTCLWNGIIDCASHASLSSSQSSSLITLLLNSLMASSTFFRFLSNALSFSSYSDSAVVRTSHCVSMAASVSSSGGTKSRSSVDSLDLIDEKRASRSSIICCLAAFSVRE
mmetsp:Transcript_53902/g.124085  ORF Transcript_53902/g.124085 Transcript_53902/m.124085 type:complete len:381 (-) Transcript_53902:1025-2167(-)